MRSVDLMIEEHRLIERMLRVLEDSAAILGRGGSVPAAMLDGMLEFIRVYADAGHHAKEEDIFFPALAGHGIVPEASAIGAFQAQHEAGRLIVRRMLDARQRMAGGDADARRGFAESAHDYVALLQEHIRLENRLFAEYAEDAFSAQEDAALRARMDDVDRLRPPDQRSGRFERMVAEYEEALLKC